MGEQILKKTASAVDDNVIYSTVERSILSVTISDVGDGLYSRIMFSYFD